MITGIILASGFSKRMGEDKLLIDLNGKKLIEYTIKACVNSNLDEIIIVYRNEEVKNIALKYNVKTILNEYAKLGQSESMKLGIINSVENSSYMFLMGDQPFITSDLIDTLIYEYNTSCKPILLPFYNGNRSMPIIISNKYKQELLDVTGDEGGRSIIKKYPKNIHYVYIENEKMGIDIDTKEDLKRVEKWI